jgi:hypothetical protein
MGLSSSLTCLGNVPTSRIAGWDEFLRGLAPPDLPQAFAWVRGLSSGLPRAGPLLAPSWLCIPRGSRMGLMHCCTRRIRSHGFGFHPRIGFRRISWRRLSARSRGFAQPWVGEAGISWDLSLPSCGPGAFLPFGMSPSHPYFSPWFYQAAVGIPPGTSSFDAAPLPLFAMAFCAKVTWGSDVSGSIPRIGFSASFSRLRDSDVSSSCWLALSVSFASSGSPVEARFLPGVALRCFASHTAMGHSQQIHLSPVHGEGCVFLRGVPTKIGRPCSRISLFQGFPQPAFF